MQSAEQIPTPYSPEVLAALKKQWDDFNDTEKFIPAALKIQELGGVFAAFQPKIAQRRFVQLDDENKRLGRARKYIVGKGRGIGMSSIIAAIIFKDTAFLEGQGSLIVAHEKGAAANLFKYYDRFQQEYTPHVGIALPRLIGRGSTETSGSLRWINRSHIQIATAANVHSARSFRFKYLHLSEAAFYTQFRGLMQALIGTLAQVPDSLVAIESTANSYNHFHRDWVDAMNGDSDFTPFFAGCFEDEYNWAEPELDGIDPYKFERQLTDGEWELVEKYKLKIQQIYWRYKKLREFKGDEQAFNAEYPHSWEVMFAARGAQQFPPHLFSWMPTDISFKRGSIEFDPTAKKPEDKVLFTPSPNGELTIWQPFTKGGLYCAGVDVAKGVDVNKGIGTRDPDYCAAVTGDRNLLEQNMEFHARQEPPVFAKTLYALGYWAKIRSGQWIYYTIEAEFSGGNGLAVIREMLRLGYPPEFLYRTVILNKTTTQRSEELGFVIRPSNRPMLIANHLRYLMGREYTAHSKPGISEHLTFVKRPNGRVEAQDECHDDLTFAHMYLTWGFEYAPDLTPERDEAAKPLRPAKWGQDAGLSRAEQDLKENERRMAQVRKQAHRDRE